MPAMNALVSVAEGVRSQLPLSGRAVDQITLDFDVRLEFSDGGPQISLRIGVPFAVNIDGHDGVVDAERPKTLGAIVGMLRRTIADAWVLPDSSLALSLDDGSTVAVQPHPDFEAWAIHAEDGSRAICLPGGGLAIWGADHTRQPTIH